MTPEQIIERHEKFPEATKQLIEAYGFQQYRKAIDDLINKFGNVVEVPHSSTILIACTEFNFNDWKNASLSEYKLKNK